ncbi:MAG TPA: HEAT repeat domain-containing protein [Thermoguttaceae bacterium]|nr:HEAT repeat domain-containing protein [Thermoguttaceae bacterium]
MLLLVLLPGTTAARVSFGISIGSPFVYHYPGFHHGWYPYHHSYSYYGRYPHCGRHSSSGLGIWIGGYHPIVIDPPVRVRSEVVTKAGGAMPDADTAEELERLRRKKSELLKVLKIGDKERRVQAIRDLAGFSSDDGVRKALESVLLSDPDPELRRQVATSFGRTENRKVVAALEEAKTTDSDKEVRQAAYRAIILIKGY